MILCLSLLTIIFAREGERRKEVGILWDLDAPEKLYPSAHSSCP
jgi:hypothetical protein